MSEKRVCPECESTVVLVDGGGVHRTILCHDCNVPMEYEESIKTHFDKDVYDYRIK
jgi:hypothetical protein